MNDLLVVLASPGDGDDEFQQHPAWLRAVPWITPLGRRIVVRIHVPTIDRAGRRLCSRSVRQAVEKLLLRVAGGGNFTNAQGIWRSAAGIVVRERVGIGDAYVDARVKPVTLNNFLVGLRRLAVEWNQEAILVVIDGWPLLVSGITNQRTAEILQLPGRDHRGPNGGAA